MGGQAAAEGKNRSVGDQNWTRDSDKPEAVMLAGALQAAAPENSVQALASE